MIEFVAVAVQLVAVVVALCVFVRMDRKCGRADEARLALLEGSGITEGESNDQSQ